MADPNDWKDADPGDWVDHPGPIRGESNPAPEWATEQEKPDQGPTQGHAVVNGFVGGATKRFADEMAGKTYELGNYLRNLIHGVDSKDAEARAPEDYRFGRASAREDMAKSEKAWPKTTFGAGMAGDLATDAVAASAGVPVFTPAGMAISGGLSGLGGSEADLTTGDPTNYLKAAGSTALGAGLGYGVGKVGQGVGRLAAGAGRKLGRAVGDSMNAEKAAAEELFESGRGLRDQRIQAAYRNLEHHKEILSNPGAPAELKARAAAFIASEEGQALQRRVWDSALEQGPRKAGDITAAETALQPLREGMTPEAITAASEERLSHPLQPVGKFALNYGNRAIHTGIGATIGGPGGAVIGAATGAVMGHPGTALKNLTNNPALRKLVWGATEKALQAGGAALGKFGPYLAREYAANPEHARAIDEALTSELPEYAAKKLELLQGRSESP